MRAIETPLYHLSAGNQSIEINEYSGERWVSAMSGVSRALTELIFTTFSQNGYIGFKHKEGQPEFIPSLFLEREREESPQSKRQEPTE